MDSFLQTAKPTTFGKNGVWQQPQFSDSSFSNSSIKNWSCFGFHTIQTTPSKAKKDD